MHPVKKIKATTTSFVKDHKWQIAYVAYLAACAALGYAGTKKYLNNQQAIADNLLDAEHLRYAVASGHSFKWEPETNTLWDLALHPEKA